MAEFLIKRESGIVGPMTAVAVRKLAAKGLITPGTEVSVGGKWVKALQIKGLFSEQQLNEYKANAVQVLAETVAESTPPAPAAQLEALTQAELTPQQDPLAPEPVTSAPLTESESSRWPDPLNPPAASELPDVWDSLDQSPPLGPSWSGHTWAPPAIATAVAPPLEPAEPRSSMPQRIATMIVGAVGLIAVGYVGYTVTIASKATLLLAKKEELTSVNLMLRDAEKELGDKFNEVDRLRYKLSRDLQNLEKNEQPLYEEYFTDVNGTTIAMSRQNLDKLKAKVADLVKLQAQAKAEYDAMREDLQSNIDELTRTQAKLDGLLGNDRVLIYKIPEPRVSWGD